MESTESNVVEMGKTTEKQLIINKDDLVQINKNRTQEQQILSAIGILEVKKMEMIAQISQIKTNLDNSVKDSLKKLGIEEKDFHSYVINPTTGEVSKNKPKN